ncbi:MAG: AI-2E family transporter [Rubrobacter sp.]|nr:AI-2E family transporter [Rubrobacter sp.]
MKAEERENKAKSAEPPRSEEATKERASERRVYVGIGLVFAILLLGYLIYEIAVVVLVILLTMLFSIIISGPVDTLEKRGWSRGLGTLVVMGGLLVALVALIAALAPTVEEQAVQFAGTLPALLEGTQAFARDAQNRLGLELPFSLEPQSLIDSARDFLSGGALSTVANVGAGVANVVSLGAVVLIATIYSVLSPGPLVNGFVAIFPAGKRERVREILFSMYSTVQRWFLGQLTSMLIIGTLWTIALFIIGVPFALLLGIFAAVVSFVPYVGPAIALVPPALIALVNDPILAVWVVATYLLIQTVESYMIQPIIMSRAVALHPAVVIFSILIMGTLFGLIGVLLAVPLTAALLVLANEMWVYRMDEVGTDPNPPKPKASDETTPKRHHLPAWLRRAAKRLRRS